MFMDQARAEYRWSTNLKKIKTKSDPLVTKPLLDSASPRCRLLDSSMISAATTHTHKKGQHEEEQRDSEYKDQTNQQKQQQQHQEDHQPANDG